MFIYSLIFPTQVAHQEFQMVELFRPLLLISVIIVNFYQLLISKLQNRPLTDHIFTERNRFQVNFRQITQKET